MSGGQSVRRVRGQSGPVAVNTRTDTLSLERVSGVRPASEREQKIEAVRQVRDALRSLFGGRERRTRS